MCFWAPVAEVGSPSRPSPSLLQSPAGTGSASLAILVHLFYHRKTDSKESPSFSCPGHPSDLKHWSLGDRSPIKTAQSKRSTELL